jgi:putative SOS response-associated peptidase YedK
VDPAAPVCEGSNGRHNLKCARSRGQVTRHRDFRAHITSFAIVTTNVAPSVAQYHDRMPVVLDNAQFDVWMRGTLEQAAAMMKPMPARSRLARSTKPRADHMC